jgi:hypothetical protein
MDDLKSIAIGAWENVKPKILKWSLILNVLSIISCVVFVVILIDGSKKSEKYEIENKIKIQEIKKKESEIIALVRSNNILEISVLAKKKELRSSEVAISAIADLYSNDEPWMVVASNYQRRQD